MAATDHFTASQDRTHKLMTAVSAGALLAALGGMLWAGAAAVNPELRITFFSIAGGIVLLIASMALFVPRRYRLDETAVVVDRPAWPVRIPLEQIRDVHPIELHDVVRTFGAAGFGGAWGRFTSRELASFRAYIRRREPLVCLELEDAKPVVLSPDDAEAFVTAVRGRLGGGNLKNGAAEL
ncbi:MAG: PH domain-containing protein [Phycisphaeraceae bacterium]